MGRSIDLASLGLKKAPDPASIRQRERQLKPDEAHMASDGSLSLSLALSCLSETQSLRRPHVSKGRASGRRFITTPATPINHLILTLFDRGGNRHMVKQIIFQVVGASFDRQVHIYITNLSSKQFSSPY